jgi:hypothetical protein
VLLGTSCEFGEPFANPMGTYWEQGKKKHIGVIKKIVLPKVA